MTDNKLRPCYVGNNKALFHGWITETKLFLKTGYFRDVEVLKGQIKAFKEDNIIMRGSETEKQTQTFALVEFENGIVRKVEPSDVVFADNKISEYKSFFE